MYEHLPLISSSVVVVLIVGVHFYVCRKVLSPPNPAGHRTVLTAYVRMIPDTGLSIADSFRLTVRLLTSCIYEYV